MVLNPEFVLLDEITSALDVEQIARILVCLKMLRERGIGVFLITHLINFARDTADQVVFLTDGNVLEAGG
ncbi:MAG: amino acid ABC transporter ATP-binding protein, partial [Dongiaceae bacterium]